MRKRARRFRSKRLRKPSGSRSSRRGRKVSEKTKRKISRSLLGRRRGSTTVAPRSETRLVQTERVSKVLRNIALASESPSKIARNASVTAKNISSLTKGADRNLNRVGKASRSIDNLSRSARRFF